MTGGTERPLSQSRAWLTGNAPPPPAFNRSQSKSNKKLLEQCVKLEKLWSHVFTATITLTDADGWYRRVKELIDKQQTAPVWMAETKVSRR